MVAKLNLSVRHTFLQKIKLYKKQLFVIAPIAILFVFAAYANTYFQQQQDLRSRAASVYNSQRCIITSQENGCPFGQYCSKSETEAGICIEQPTNVLFNQATELKALSTQIANNSLRYLHTTWWNQNYTTNPKNFNVIVMPKEGKFSNTVATGATIRAQAMTAHATALALNGGFYDAQEVTVDSSTALYRTVGLINGLAQQYKSTDGWKFSPFTILVMQYTAFAAKQVWDYLPASTQEIMNNAVASGADHLLTVPPPYYKNADGKILFPGDSKSEENAWVGAFLFLAARLYPDNLNAAKWEEQALNYMIASHATPSQVGTDPRIKGSNLNEDGTVINHDHLAVDYMFAYAEIIQTNQLIAAQSNTGLPSEGTHNFKLVWNAFTQLNFPASSYSPPGGTILRKDAKGNPTANIYYPKGVDAGIEVRFKPVTTATEVFLQNIDTSGYDWAKAFQIYVLNQQSRRPDGRVFSEEEVRTVEFEPFVAVLEAENVFRLAIAISPATITPTQITSKIETILPVGAPPTVTLSSPADESAFTYEASYLPSLQARGNSQTPRLKMAFRIKKNSTGECYTSWIIGTKNIWLYSLPSGYVFKYLFSQSSFPKLYPLAPGTYTWSAKAIDDKGVFSQSNGVRFCDSDGWAPERTFTIQPKQQSFRQVLPTVALTSPANLAVYNGTSTLPSLQARGNSQTPRLKMAFRIKKNSTGECYTSWNENPNMGYVWTYSEASGAEFKYLFSQSSFPKLYPLASGTYTWSAKAVDDYGLYSKNSGVLFCNSDGWAPERTFTINSSHLKPTTTPPTVKPPTTTPPTVTLTSPANSSVFAKAFILPELKARGNSQTPRLKMAFRIKKNSTGECYTSWIIGTKNIWLYSLPSGYVFKYLFSQSSFPKLYPLAPGTYTWSAKAIDDKGVFSQSNGVRFCDSDGWAPERTIILK